MTDAIDWGALAEKLGTLTASDGVRREAGGTDLARHALLDIIGDEAFRDAVDFYVSLAPGYELARSVLWLLGPPAAMERCREIFRSPANDQQAADAVYLLQAVADQRVLDWIPEFLASDNVGVRVWAIGIVDQLLIMRQEIALDEAMPLLVSALADPAENVRAQARSVMDMAVDEASRAGR